MKKLIAVLLVLVLALSMAACKSAPVQDSQSANTNIAADGKFCVGFGRGDVTPKDSVPMASYGNAKDRMSEGLYTYQYVNVLAVGYEEDILLLITIDNSWFSAGLARPIREQISDIHNIPLDHILMQGTHTHAAIDSSLTEIPAVGRSNTRTTNATLQAVADAIADMKPAEIYVGSVMTKNMNFCRRYIMDDGSLTGDNYPGTGTTIVAHETEADPELQLLRFVREGDKDILIGNFQSHPHLEGKNPYLSYQTIGAFRTAAEELLDVHCIGWQGAAGNINTRSRIESENIFTNDDRDLYGEALANYAASIWNDMTKVNAGPIKVVSRDVTCEVNHSEDHLVVDATNVNRVFTNTNNSTQAMQEDTSGQIKSVYHASAILRKQNLAATKDIPLVAFSFGDVSGIVVPYEMFDTSGMQIKSQTPFEKTFIFGYAFPGGHVYMPDQEAYDRGGYEVNNCNYVKGTAELLVQNYLEMLAEMRK